MAVACAEVPISRLLLLVVAGSGVTGEALRKSSNANDQVLRAKGVGDGGRSGWDGVRFEACARGNSKGVMVVGPPSKIHRFRRVEEIEPT